MRCLMPSLGRAVLDIVPGAGILKGRALKISPLVIPLDQRDCSRSGAKCSDLDYIVGEDGVDLVENRRD